MKRDHKTGKPIAGTYEHTELKLYTALVFLMVFALLFSISKAAFAVEDLPSSLPYAPEMPAMTAEPMVEETTAPVASSARSAAEITIDDAQACLTEELEANGTADAVKVRLTGRMKPLLWRGREAADWSCEIQSLDEQKHTFAAEIQVRSPATGEALAEPIALEARYEEWQKLPVLKRRMGKSDVIKMDDIAWKTVAPRSVKGDVVTDAEELIGKSPLRMLMEDRVIRTSQIGRPAVVSKGDMVSMVFRKLNLEVKATASAMESGADGDIISVRNMDTNKLIKGIVRGPGLIEVMPLPAMHEAGMKLAGR